ncbi:MAG: homoserine dehydrogenase [Candidatus Methanomethylicia archaeon]|nr:homoserine dehydrogenase [Candidatus Methanomethylicia archaeon]
MHFDIAFIGFGTVGRGMAELLLEKKSILEKLYNITWRVVAISDLRYGSIINDNGIDLKEALSLVESNKDFKFLNGKRGLSSIEVIKESNSNLIVEVTWTNLIDGEPGYSHMKTALNLGKNVITTNKGPIALYYKELKELANRKNAQLRYKGTVMSGTPSFNIFEGPLAGCNVESIRGILNGTTNFILTEMEKGLDYEQALKEAQRLGYAEADPTMDVEGLDATAKLVILINTIFDMDIKLNDIRRKGITSIRINDIKEALNMGKRIKLIAKAEKIDNKILAEVSPQYIPISDPLANIMGVMNAITFKTDCLGDVTIVGPGAGKRATGYALISDMIAISNKLSKD